VRAYWDYFSVLIGEEDRSILKFIVGARTLVLEKTMALCSTVNVFDAKLDF
jgi:hypothetical protein